MEYPNNLRRIRDGRKLTQADVAEALGINQAEYSRIEKGRRRVGTHLESLSEILECHQDDILAPDQYAGGVETTQHIPFFALPEVDGESIRFDMAMTSQLPKPTCVSGLRAFAILNPGGVMNPRLSHGDFLFADPDEEVREQDLCILTLLKGNREVAIVRQHIGGDVYARLDIYAEETFGDELKTVSPIIAIKLAR